MKRVKRRTFYGSICEQEVFNIKENTDPRTAEPQEPRFRTIEDREHHRTEISRRRHTRLFNANFSHESLYSTLTLDNENEVHEYEEMRRLRDNYIRRIRRRYPDAVIFAYIGKGENTHRMHLHMVSNGIPEEEIKNLWKYGKIRRIEPLREHNIYNGVDHGEDFTALANYLFDHWEPEYGGHRWFNTKNAARPEPETPRIVKRNYTKDHPPVAPRGYVLVDVQANRYGYIRFIYVIKPGPRRRTKKEPV